MQYTLDLYQPNGASRAALNGQIAPHHASREPLCHALQAPLARLAQSYAPDFAPLWQALEPALLASPWMIETLTHNSAWLGAHLSPDLEWLDCGDIGSALGGFIEDDLPEADYMRALRQFRNLMLLKIGSADLLGLASLDQTLRQLSDLAQALCAHACAAAYKLLCARHGVPCDEKSNPVAPVILGMGKLGGRELNFSSDIDLMVMYRAKGVSDGAKAIDNQSFFTKLAQMLIKFLDTRTADGFVYRVDMRLRPFGESGALALSFTAAEQYYQSQGRPWERYALIKACVLVGEKQDAKLLRASLNAFVYRRYLDFSALQSLRELKRMIAAQIERQGADDNIKLGSGGIREVEFIAQSFQLIYGGKDENLQQRGLAEVFAELAKSGHFHSDLIAQLLASYQFLRMLENRLQLVNDAQCHSLPNDSIGRMRCAYSMGFDSWQHFSAALVAHRQQVAATFAEVFAQQEPQNHSHWQKLWEEADQEDDADQYRHSREALDMGLVEFASLRKNLAQLRAASSYKLASLDAKDRVDAFMPLLLAALAAEFARNSKLSDADKYSAFMRAMNFLRQVVRRSTYLVLLQENPSALARLVLFLVKSSWVSDLLSAQPVLLDSVLDARELLSLKDKDSLQEELKELIGKSEGASEELFDNLRQFKNNHILRVAAMDITGAMPLMQVSDQLTACAELLVAAVLKFAVADTVKRHGVPICQHADGSMYVPEMAVIGYGKLGGIELGYASDLDVVFVHNGTAVKAYTQGREDGGGVIDNSLFFARAAQRFSTMMQTNTRLGQLYEIDTRLRPDGNSGEWVKSLSGFASYQLKQAWTWEHQALVRARFIAGSAVLQNEFAQIRQQVLCQARDIGKLQQDVASMREKMRTNLGTGNQAQLMQAFNLKQDRGGVADIEFIVQFLLLAHASQTPALIEYSDVIRSLELIGQHGFLKADRAQILIDSYRAIRAKIHSLALDKRGAQVAELDGELLPVIQQVAQIWGEIFSQ